MNSPDAVHDAAQLFGEFAHSLRRDAIPDAVRKRACHHIVDAVGIALVSAKQDFARNTAAGLNHLAGVVERGDMPVIGMSHRASFRDAAILNGLLCHGLDFDDTYLAGVVHPTASAFPAALSAACRARANGNDLLTAYILGVEITGRLGAAAQGQFHEKGFHPTGLAGVFGCAVAAGRIFGFDAAELASAQGIALSLASGSLEFLQDGAWNKRLHPGWAAQAGLVAASFAKHGFVGASRPYAGRFGLFRSYAQLDDTSTSPLLASDLGSRWVIADTAIKPLPTCHFTHAAIDAALQLRAKIADPDAIERAVVLVPREVMAIVCEPIALKRRPRNDYDARFSIPFLVAAAFVRGLVSLAELDAEALEDRRILRLADRIDCEPDPAADFPKFYSGEVRLALADGQRLEHREGINRGAPERPLANDEILEKFALTARYAVTETRAREIAATILDIDNICDANDLAAALSA